MGGEPERTRPARALFVDERGHGLRATWHLDRGFVHLSMWRDDRCVETLRLSAEEAARLLAFLADGLPPTPARAPGVSVPSV